MDKPPADADMLVDDIYGKIGKVAGIVEVSNRTRNADEFICVPSSDSQVAVPEHAFHAFPIVNRAPFGQRIGSARQ